MKKGWAGSQGVELPQVAEKGLATSARWRAASSRHLQHHQGPVHDKPSCYFSEVPDFAADLKEKTGRSMYKFLMPLASVQMWS